MTIDCRNEREGRHVADGCGDADTRAPDGGVSAIRGIRRRWGLEENPVTLSAHAAFRSRVAEAAVRGS